MYSIIGASLFGIIIIMTMLVTLGYPLGEYTMGGRYKVLPPVLRAAAGASVVIQSLAVVVILQAGGFITTIIPKELAEGLCYLCAIYLSINVLLNIFAKSKKERFIMTPLSLIAAFCFWICAVNS